MKPRSMISTLRSIGRDVEVDDNVVNFTFEDVPIALIFDTAADRMRLISPIVESERIDETMLLHAMEANFHSVLDARYAISSGLVWSVFLHPLSDLSGELLRSAVEQVAIARLTFGNEYTSGLLFFGSANEDGEPN
ncbi:MAG: hypothetical protein AAGC60_29590 [Acidobacteriota bacterium]